VVSSFERSFQELINLNVIEKQNDTIYRIYNECFLIDMEINFNLLKESTRDSIKGKFLQTYNGLATASTGEAMLEGAETAYKQADYQTAADRYRQIINDPKLSPETRCKAIKQLLIQIERTSNADELISTFANYRNKYPELTSSPAVIHQYIYSLWTNNTEKGYIEVEKCFKKFDEPDIKNLVLFALCATFYTKYILMNHKNNKKNLENAFFRCNQVYLFVSNMDDRDFGKYITSQTKQNVRTCLIQAFDISIELSKTDKSYTKNCSDIACFFCNKYPYEEADLKHFGDFRVYPFEFQKLATNSVKGTTYGFIGKVFGKDSLLHISKCASRYISPKEMKKCSKYLENHTVNVKIIETTDDGYKVSLIGVTPSFDDIISTI